MRRNKLCVYVHFVWSTWDREPFITPAIERNLHRSVEAICRENGCEVLAIGGLEDHMHILVSMPSTITIADLMRRAKGGSSKYANEALVPRDTFRWQGS